LAARVRLVRRVRLGSMRRAARGTVNEAWRSAFMIVGHPGRIVDGPRSRGETLLIK